MLNFTYKPRLNIHVELITKKRLNQRKTLKIFTSGFYDGVLSSPCNQLISWFKRWFFEPGMTQKENRTLLKTKRQRFLKNEIGTFAWLSQWDPHSGFCTNFLSTIADNSFLNHRTKRQMVGALCCNL